jgi:hypothetical protein
METDCVNLAHHTETSHMTFIAPRVLHLETDRPGTTSLFVNVYVG